MKTVSRKIAYTGDTRFSESIIKKASNIDLLIADATYISKTDESAYETGHMSVREALEMAEKAKVKRILLTHHSLRYPSKRFVEEVDDLTIKHHFPFYIHIGLEPFEIR